MTIATVSYYDRLPLDANGNVLPILIKPLASASYVPAATQQATAAPTAARYARVCSDVGIHVGYGATATSADPYVGAGAPEYFEVWPGLQLALLLAA